MSASSVKARDLIDRAGSAFKARDIAAYVIATTVAEGRGIDGDTVQAFRLLDRLVSVQLSERRATR